jgi:formylglycine-generating enzyme required for sulfatase activity
VEGLTPVYTIADRKPAIGYPIKSATVTWKEGNPDGYRLPTEAEWEYACRADTTTAFNFREREWVDGWVYDDDEGYDVYIYYGDPTGEWGSDYIWTDWANFDGGYDYNDRITDPNGYWYGNSLPKWVFEDYPNQWDLYNMHGNLEEWCWDWYERDYGGDQEDPKGPASGTARILRGGSWYDTPVWVRSAMRNGTLPEVAYFSGRWDDTHTIGFRVVKNAPSGGSRSSSVAPAVNARSGTAKQGLRILPQRSTRNFNKNSASPGKFEFLRRETIIE